MIRPLSILDLDAFRKIRLEALTLEPAAFASTLYDWEKMSDAEWENRLSTSVVCGAFNGVDLIGIMGLARQSASKMRHRANLIMVYVQKQFRGSTVARNLLNETITQARLLGIRQVELAASIENPAAIRFYQREGFHQIGIIPGGFVHDGREIDEVMMAKRIA